jgi:ParB-like chromosome segregation protein Spo0J
MRFRACKEAGIQEIPVIVTDLPEDKQREFLIKDNTSGGEWDWDMLANEWDTDELEAWGLDLPVFDLEPDYDELIGEEKNKPATMKITFNDVEQLQEAENDIQELIDRKFKGAFYSVSAGEI